MKRTPMRRSGWLRRRKPVASHQIGSGIPPETRIAVLIRDHGHCVACGCWLANVPSGIHHRLLRSRGGKHGMENLIHLCTPCHSQVHTGDTVQAGVDGFILASGAEGDDPEAVPVFTWEGWRHYMTDGTVLSRDEYRQHRTGGAA